ncbi:photoreceptor-specific nuclear receptor isoform X2 [Nematostella vectensis]|uniref:photoreceptor-specific nuclear receptor isoform X2 n=1 Tax=Nematostella vectensis TaxID=45351 RepID=UPI0020779471|nr:photoreceptor-specific nuclear receptor isoform X2 [Nematostella vectensis]
MATLDTSFSPRSKNEGKQTVQCRVCGDRASGKHYGVMTCDGCRGFFKRSVRRNLAYQCKEKNDCPIDVARRNQCQACRLRKCFEMNMNRDAVQHERAPRTSQIRQNSQSKPLKRKHISIENMSADQIKTKSDKRAYQQVDSRSSGFEKPIDDMKNVKCLPPVSIASNLTISPTPHSVGIPVVYMDMMYESAIRVLYMTVKWVRNIPTFLDLPFRDQAILIEESWSELFVLSLSQWDMAVDLSSLVSAAYPQQMGLSPGHKSDRTPGSMSDIRNLQTVVSRLRTASVDQTEYACLKAIVLFKPDIRGLRLWSHVEQLQDQAQCMLGEYELQHYPDQVSRFGKLLLSLPSLKSIPPKAIERLFFSGTLDNIPMERLLADMFKSS